MTSEDPRAAPAIRTPLNRDRIVDAAIAYIDQHGLTGLTMRRLGGVLGVEAMALYRHVPSRDDLLDAVVERVVDEMHADDEVLAAPRDGWQDFLQRLAHGIRRIALAHPEAFPLIASRPPEAPWLRPPLRSLRWVELFLDGLLDEGFSDAAAVAAYRGFSSFLLGHLLLEVVAKGAELSPIDPPDPGSATTDIFAEHPTIGRLQHALAEDHALAEFEESLENLLARIEQLRREL